MKKIILMLALLFTAGSILVACAENDNGDTEVEDPDNNDDTGTNEENDDENNIGENDNAENNDNETAGDEAMDRSMENTGVGLEAEGDTEENEMGVFTLVQEGEAEGEAEHDLFTVGVNGVKVVDAEVEADYEEEFLSSDSVLIFVDFESEHAGDDMAGIYPDQSRVEVQLGEDEPVERANSINHLSDDAGGEFTDGETREGWVVYEVPDTSADDISSITVMVDAPHDENYDPVGEDPDSEEEPEPLEIEINLS